MKYLVKQRYRIHRWKQPTYIISQACKSDLEVGSTDFSALSFTKPKPRCWSSGILLRIYGKNLPSNLLRLLAKISYPWKWDYNYPFLTGWQLGGIFCFKWLHIFLVSQFPSSTFKASNDRWIVSCVWVCLIFLLFHLFPASTFLSQTFCLPLLVLRVHLITSALVNPYPG